MKTLGRILIILAAFALVMGITYGIVNSVSSSTTVRGVERGGENTPRPEEGVQPPFPAGQRPRFPGGEGRAGGSVIRLILGTVKNIGLVALVVVLVVWLKNYMEKRKRDTQRLTE